MNKTNKNKLTKKEYISKYIYLKILFDNYQINDFIPSESVMSNLFNTTNLTVRTAYNNLIQKGIIKAQKGKGYIVLKNIASYLFDQWENLNKLDQTLINNSFIYKDKLNEVAILKFQSSYLNGHENIDSLLSLFKIIFKSYDLDEIILNKKLLLEKDELVMEYIYCSGENIIVNIELKIKKDFIILFNYKKHFTLY